MSSPDRVDAESPIRFIVDDHLRRLARWLRSAGLDAAWEPEIENRELYRRSWVEKRTILTMDRKLWAPRLHRLTSHDVREQLRDVVTTFGIDPYEHAFTRCVVCNVPLEAAAKEDVEGDVPPNAYARYDRYQRCASCRRVFWRGTHTERTLRFFTEATGRPPPERLITGP
ncbi:MAG: Mut7-C RNAse domain-containing protein [Planctomycetota bacterium]